MSMKPFADIFTRVRKNRPLVHHITNYVTVNDCANITLCAGGAPVMAEAPEEAAEMVVDAVIHKQSRVATDMGRFQQVWNLVAPKSYASSCKVLHLAAGDGIEHAAEFRFTK